MPWGTRMAASTSPATRSERSHRFSYPRAAPTPGHPALDLVEDVVRGHERDLLSVEHGLAYLMIIHQSGVRRRHVEHMKMVASPNELTLDLGRMMPGRLRRIAVESRDLYDDARRCAKWNGGMDVASLGAQT